MKYAKIKLIALLTLAMLLQITGCNRNPYATLPPFTPTFLPLTAVYEVMPTRYESSKNTISVSVEFKGVRSKKKTNKFLDSRRVKLVVHFKNVSANSIVFRRPISYGFVGTDGSVNDLAIFIEMKNVLTMNVTSNSNYPRPGEFSPFPEITFEDFLEIKPDEVFSYSIEVVPPGVLIEETKYVGNLPPGTYKLQVEYTNYDIGYELPLKVTPPASFENPQARFDWYSNHTMVVDLNAWVGHVLSNEVDVTIPAE